MQLDEMKELWAAQGARLERSLRLDERILREVTGARTRSALAPFVCKKAWEVALGLVLALLLGSFLVAHLDQPRFVACAGLLDVFVIGMTAASAHQLVHARRIDHSGPVLRIQRDLERIKQVEYRALKWVVLASCLLWVPLAVVLLEALLDVDLLARVEPLWVAANLALGVVVLTVGLALGRRYVERPDARPWARRLVDHASGRRLASVSEFLDELSSFEREEPA